MAITTLNLADFTATCREKTVTKMGELVSNNWDHIHSEEISDLGHGIFYPNSYFERLKAKGQTRRLEWLRERGHFYHGFAPKSHFTHLSSATSPTKKEFMGYQLKPGKLPSESLKALRTGLTLLGCGEACQLAQYEALNEILGDDKFNALFAADSSTPLSMGYNSPCNPLTCLMTIEDRPVVAKKLQPGMIVHIHNTIFYSSKHINGEAQGSNVIYIGDGKFLGLGHNPQGITLQEIKRDLIREYNKPNDLDTAVVTEQVAQKILSSYTQEYLQFRQELKHHTIQSFEANDIGGTFAPRIVDLDYEKVHRLYTASIKEARQLFSTWHAQLTSTKR